MGGRLTRTVQRTPSHAIDQAIYDLELKQLELEAQNQELKNAHASLERVCERFSDLYDSAPMGYVTLDPRLEIREANRTAIEQFGIQPSFGACSFLHKIAVEERDSFLKSLTQCKRNAARTRVELRLENAEQWLDVELTLMPVFASDSSLRYFYVMISDIGERKAQLRMIAEQRAKLIGATRLAAVGEMAANIAHEINNPLSIIVFNAEALEKMLATELQMGAEKALKIKATAFRISNIVKSLLRLTKGGDSEPMQSVSLSSIVDDALELCEQRFANSNIRIDKQPLSSAIELECRPVQIAQVLMNLLANAYDAAKLVESGWVALEFEDCCETVNIWVTNKSHAPPAEARARVFEPFFTTKPTVEGSGLGLSVSRAIVRDHGGSLSVDAWEPTTRFRISLPKSRH